MTFLHSRSIPRVRYNPAPVRRFLHILLNTAAVLSLLLFVATSILWVRGYSLGEGWIHGTDRHTFHILSVRNGIYIAWFKGMQNKTPSQWFRRTASDYAQMFGGGWRFAGLGYVHHIYNPPTPYAEFWAWAIPHWLLLLASAPIPLWRVIRWRASRRQRLEGLCSTCGYDLRATPGRCPECGGVAAG